MAEQKSFMNLPLALGLGILGNMRPSRAPQGFFSTIGPGLASGAQLYAANQPKPVSALDQLRLKQLQNKMAAAQSKNKIAASYLEGLPEKERLVAEVTGVSADIAQRRARLKTLEDEKESLISAQLYATSTGSKFTGGNRLNEVQALINSIGAPLRGLSSQQPTQPQQGGSMSPLALPRPRRKPDQFRDPRAIAPVRPPVARQSPPAMAPAVAAAQSRAAAPKASQPTVAIGPTGGILDKLGRIGVGGYGTADPEQLPDLPAPPAAAAPSNAGAAQPSVGTPPTSQEKAFVPGLEYRKIKEAEEAWRKKNNVLAATHARHMGAYNQLTKGEQRYVIPRTSGAQPLPPKLSAEENKYISMFDSKGDGSVVRVLERNLGLAQNQGWLVNTKENFIKVFKPIPAWTLDDSGKVVRVEGGKTLQQMIQSETDGTGKSFFPSRKAALESIEPSKQDEPTIEAWNTETKQAEYVSQRKVTQNPNRYIPLAGAPERPEVNKGFELKLVQDADGNLAWVANVIPGSKPAIESKKDLRARHSLGNSARIMLTSARKRLSLIKSRIAEAKERAPTNIVGAWIYEAVKDLPGTSSRSLKGNVRALRSLAGLDELGRMRQEAAASGNTGSGLGQVTEKEHKLLQDQWANLDPASSNFNDELDRYFRSAEAALARIEDKFHAERGAGIYGPELKEEDINFGPSQSRLQKGDIVSHQDQNGRPVKSQFLGGNPNNPENWKRLK
jgi:hypothetical protein